jgi:putative transposase
LLQVPWSTLHYKSRKKTQEALRRRLHEIAATHVRYGYRRLTVLLRREGWKVNAKCVHWLYDEENLRVRSVERKKIARRQRVPQAQAIGPNHCWSADFVSDKLSDGRAIRILTVIDQFTRECIWLEVDRSMSGPKVVAALTRAITERGAGPRSMTLDNGSEFAGRATEAWAIQTGVQLRFIRPGRPVENGFIESFNGRIRDECLNVEWFTNLTQAREKLADWRYYYNHQRPHSSLDDRAPAVFAGLHGGGTTCLALSLPNKANGEPRQDGMRRSRGRPCRETLLVASFKVDMEDAMGIQEWKFDLYQQSHDRYRSWRPQELHLRDRLRRGQVKEKQKNQSSQ